MLVGLAVRASVHRIERARTNLCRSGCGHGSHGLRIFDARASGQAATAGRIGTLFSAAEIPIFPAFGRCGGTSVPARHRVRWPLSGGQWPALSAYHSPCIGSYPSRPSFSPHSTGWDFKGADDTGLDEVSSKLNPSALDFADARGRRGPSESSWSPPPLMPAESLESPRFSRAILARAKNTQAIQPDRQPRCLTHSSVACWSNPISDLRSRW